MSRASLVRPVRPEDVPAVVSMVHELASFEKEPESCHLTAEQLGRVLFQEKTIFGHVAVDENDEPIGMALWLLNFSTWEGTNGLYLEDLYVRPSARGTGAGAALMAALAQVCVDRGFARMEWVMLDWNPAGDFYARIGAKVTENWLPYRLTGPALRELAAQG